MYVRVTFVRDGLEGTLEFDSVRTLTEAERKARRELKGATILKIETPAKVKYVGEGVMKKELEKPAPKRRSMGGRPRVKRKR